MLRYPMKNVKESVSKISAVICLAIIASSSQAQTEPNGPPVHFERSGNKVCVSYVIDGNFDLYKKKIFARANNKDLKITGLPQASPRKGFTEEEAIFEKNFKACTSTPTSDSVLTWIDQSCLVSQGLCLPPRGFEVDERGKSHVMDSSVVAALFGKLVNTSSSSNEWGAFSFKPK